MPESLLPRRIAVSDRSYPEGEYDMVRAWIARHHPEQSEGNPMPILFDVTFARDTDTRLRMRYMARDLCFRTESIAYGTAAENLWTAMTDITEFYFDQDRKDKFLKLMTDEHDMIRGGVSHDEPKLKLQPLLGRFLSIIPSDGRHPMTVAAGCPLTLFWAGPGTRGTILEDEVNTITEVPRT